MSGIAVSEYPMKAAATATAPCLTPPDQSDTAASSISWNREFCHGAWVLSSYADVSAALRDPRFSVQRSRRWINSSIDPARTDRTQRIAEQHQLRAFKRILSRSLLFLDGHSHTRLRRVMQAGFSAAALQRQAPAISAIAERLIRQILARATVNASGVSVVEFDFISDFARPLPIRVIAELLGISLDGHTGFVAAASAIAAFIGSPTPSMPLALAAQDALAQLLAHFRHEIALRRTQPRDDLVGQLMEAESTGAISAMEMLAQCCTLLFAGYETTRHLLGNGVLALLQHPLQWQALQASPERLPRALRELLRYHSPVQYTGRRLTADLEWHGQQLRRGQLVILQIAAANRDPQRFSNPDQLDISRDEGNHLAFGHGPHVCIGATLTYMEAELAMRALLRALPDLQLQPQGWRWDSNDAYRGLTTLPLTCVIAPPAVQVSTASSEPRHG